MAAAIALLGAVSLFGGQQARAESMRQVLKTEIRLSSDLTVTETIHQEMTPLVESAVRSAAQTSCIIHDHQAEI